MGRVNSVDLYRDAIFVPSAVRAHHVRELRGCALWADTARGALEAPVGRAAATSLGLTGLALWNCHRSSLSPGTGEPVTLRWIPRTRGPQIGVRPV